MRLSKIFYQWDSLLGIPQTGFKWGFNTIREIIFKQFFKNYYDSEFNHYKEKPENYHELNNVNLGILYKGIEICDSADFRVEFQSLKCPIAILD